MNTTLKSYYSLFLGMKISYSLFFTLTLLFFACEKNPSDKALFLTPTTPNQYPITFKTDVIPENKLIHKGIFSPDYETYYFVLSDTNFTNFDTYSCQKKKNAWTSPKEAFFNTEYDEHGISFSPNGNTIYFSSTRPVNQSNIIDTWHIWQSEKMNGKWTRPKFVDIPNMKNKLVSHPSISKHGTLYFHASNLDYSDMQIYYSKLENGRFTAAQEVNFPDQNKLNKCTPFIALNEEYLIYAAIGNELDLWIRFKKEDGRWSKSQRFNDLINTNGQGNPFVTPDHKYLFFTTDNESWQIKWVNIENQLRANIANAN